MPRYQDTESARSAEPLEANACVRAAFFDVDNTIVRGASAFHLAKGLYRREFFSTRDLIEFSAHLTHYLLFGESRTVIDIVRTRALEIITGHSVAELTAIAEDIYDEVLTHRIYPGTRRLLDAHVQAGDEVWLITASPIEIGELIAHRMGATGALGTVAERIDGVYTGRLVGDLMHGEAKAAAVVRLAEDRGIDLDASSAYADSANDIPMMSLVGHPCAINPDRRLRATCRTVGWPVREFRRRRHTRRSLNAAAVTGAAWVSVLVVRSLRRRIRSRRAIKAITLLQGH